MEILKVENLTKTYGSGENLVNAVDDVSFSVEKGEFLAIVGASQLFFTLSVVLTVPQAEKFLLTATI
jgi:ABC-type microcin C transport system duplicated ATPase subunit YejF